MAQSVPGPSIPATDRTITTVAFHPGGQLVASAGTDVRLAQVPDRNRPGNLGPALLPGSDQIGGTVAISGDGGFLAADTRRGYDVVLWHISDPRHPVAVGKLSIGPGSMFSVAFSPDNTTLVGGNRGQIRIWNVADPRRPHLLASLEGHRPGTRRHPDMLHNRRHRQRNRMEKHLPDIAYRPGCP
jgi:WD40 repeat protein